MQKLALTITSIIALIVICSVLLCACNGGSSTQSIKNTQQAIEEAENDEYFADGNFKTVLRFAVASDVHINDNPDQDEKLRLAKFFDVSYDYSEKATYHNTLDAVVFVGDILTSGTKTQMKYYNDIVSSKIKDETNCIYLYGSHEYQNGGQDFIRQYDELYENEKTAHVVINGFHFIYLSPDQGNTNNFSADLQNWLDEELAKATAEDPTKPVFVFQHPHIANTVYGSERWSVPMLNHVLNKYPQVMDFSGHSHYPMSDPRSIHQNKFTSLNCGGLSYYEMGLIGYKRDHIFATDNEGHFARKSNQKDQGEFYIVEVDATGATKITGYDLLNDREIVHYNLKTPTEPASFIYTDARYTYSEKPAFASDAAITILAQTSDSVTFKFPIATCKDNVQNYKINIKKWGVTIKSEYVLSDTFYFNAPTEFTRTYSSKLLKTPYTIEVTAVSSFKKASEPLTVTVNPI